MFQLTHLFLEELKAIDDKVDVDKCLNKISKNVRLEELCAKVEYIQESAPEILSVKQELFARLDNLSPQNVVIGSSSSAIPISKITQNLRGQHRCLIAHPANPPHLIPCVEICPGENTSTKSKNMNQKHRNIGIKHTEKTESKTHKNRTRKNKIITNEYLQHDQFGKRA